MLNNKINGVNRKNYLPLIYAIKKGTINAKEERRSCKMKLEERIKVLDTMAKIGEQVDKHLDIESQERGNITYYNDFEFGASGLGS